MIIRYMILSPVEEARQAFLGGLFGTFELSPKGRGEKVVLPVKGGALEVVGTGVSGKLQNMTIKLFEGGVQMDGILILIPSGDDASWKEAKSIAHWVQSNERPVAVKTWVFNSIGDLDKETTRKTLLTLTKEHEKHLASG
ncbi:MAG: hypothetical protein RRA15_01855 [bacterium]|nr:hypothetical protein [bacterium]MDT8365225.1 hypothetical protein [bacterium]